MKTLLIIIIVLFIISLICLAYYLGQAFEQSKWKEMIRKGIINKPKLETKKRKREVMCSNGCGRIATNEYDDRMYCGSCWDKKAGLE